MKKVLIFGYTLDMGGAEKALIDTLNFLKDKFEIDLYLLEKKGILLNKLPKNINVYQLKNNIFSYCLFRFIPFFRKLKINKIANKKDYSCAIAYLEGRCGTWVADINKKIKKIAWIHNDVEKFDIGIKEKEIIETYNKIDKIIVVSKHSQESFCQKYHFSKEKVKVIYNLINEKEILSQAKLFKVEKKKFTFVNVAKMREQKRHDRIIRATKILKDKGYDFEVWLIGDGPLEKEISAMIKKENLTNYVKMLGLKSNPYPYMKFADYFILSSDHEGYPVCLLEALLLKLKIITTNVSGAKEMLKNDKYGLIVDISTKALASKMAEVIDNPAISHTLEENLKKYQGDNENIKKELLNLLND